MTVGVCLDAGIKTCYFLAGILDLTMPAELSTGKYCGEDNLNAVGLGNLRHGDDVAQCALLVVRSCILCHIICAGIDDDHSGVECHDILTEANQKLIGCLAGDAPPDIAVTGKELRAHVAPVLSDGVAHEHHALAVVRLCNDGLVLLCILSDVSPVSLCADRHT